MNEYRWNDLSIGLTHTFEACFTAADAQTFATISGDRNPLHLDADDAQAAHFAAPLLHGMLVASLYSQLVGMHLPGRYALLHGMDLHFHAPCYAGETLRCEGSIVELSEGFERIEIKATIRKADGTLASRAHIRAGLQRT